MAKGRGGVVLIAVAVGALLLGGHTTGSDSTSATGVDPADPAGSSDSAARSVDPPAPAVPGQREKDQDAPAVSLVVDPLDDECVLNAADVRALTGEPADRTAMTSLPAADGRSVRGCVAYRGENQLVLMNVYRVRGGDPADAVRTDQAGGRRFLDGVGRTAAVVDSRSGPTLQVAGDQFLVTVAVAFQNPSDDAWRTAGKTALDRVE